MSLATGGCIVSQKGCVYRQSLNIYNYIKTTKTFNIIYIFLYNSYLPKVAFSLVYLLKKKIKVFIDFLKLLKFEKSCKRSKFLVKY